MIKPAFALIFILCCINIINAQDLLINRDYHIDQADRLQILYPDSSASSSALRFSPVNAIIKQGVAAISQLSSGDKAAFDELANQYDFKGKSGQADTSIFYKSQKPLLKYFYKSPHHFFSIDAPNFQLRANPIVLVSGGNVSNDAKTPFQNTRGAEIYGYIDNKIYFFSRILENQQRFLPWTEDYISDYKSIPQQGFYKNYESSVLGGISGYDFLNAQAYVGLPISKSVSVELGHGRHFIGNGLRSLLLSDFSNQYFYLKFNTKVWKLHYQNIFAELGAVSANQLPGDLLLNKKYMASHYLSYRAGNSFEIGIFESVVFARQNQFEFQYLNPVIFYRMVEQFLGSPDNAMIGLNLAYDVKKKFRIYGQLLLDELNLGLFKQDGWWGNKHGIQAGVKYINVLGVDRLDVTAEYNMVRPFTYSHDREEQDIVISNYTHYNSPLAHPLGSNFREFLFRCVYRGIPRLNIELDAAYMLQGKNPAGQNIGSDPRINNTSRLSDFNNNLLQGDLYKTPFLRLYGSYAVWPNYQLFLQANYRNSKAKENGVHYDHVYIGGGISINATIDKNIY